MPSPLGGGRRAGVVTVRKLPGLRLRLAEADDMIRAIRAGEVDAVVGTGEQGLQVFTLEGAEHAYRILIESMNEGALTLTADKTVLFANACFARMVGHPLERVIGGSFRRFLSNGDRTLVRRLLKRVGPAGSKCEIHLNASGGSRLPVRISIRPLPGSGAGRAAIGMVVTDMTEARRTEALLRALTHRVVRVQESERGRVALELHDNITQLLCGIVFRSEALVARLSALDSNAKKEAQTLRDLLGQVANEVERISRYLRPGILDQLGLVAALRTAGGEFAKRTGIALQVVCKELAARLPPETELTLFRILQESLRNVERHARAGLVKVRLVQHGLFVQLVIRDDGIGFDQARHLARRPGKGGLGLLAMRERATYMGGALTIKSGRDVGTEIEVRIPLPPQAA